eukprot:CAMPEP_0180404552 /NCGR_PEP_ID=MMETSP0989-20121125/40100_1 /TAXON_ID=697907 /ORGANISM="non described non described, Strain CCMP2293" /LENGTH=191 /DNA_ID=CAMNT_0022408023 /DNA_START=14 /DNA_END=591 /DNA_ORIENTATION=-
MKRAPAVWKSPPAANSEPGGESPSTVEFGDKSSSATAASATSAPPAAAPKPADPTAADPKSASARVEGRVGPARMVWLLDRCSWRSREGASSSSTSSSSAHASSAAGGDTAAGPPQDGEESGPPQDNGEDPAGDVALGLLEDMAQAGRFALNVRFLGKGEKAAVRVLLDGAKARGGALEARALKVASAYLV